MGYHTEFEGHFKIHPPLQAEQIEYINTFSQTRRMCRDANLAKMLPDPIREAVGLPIGQEGEFFVGATGYMGQDNDASVKNYNNPPSTQPGLWCHWEVSEDGSSLQWNGAEKFYDYAEWLAYLDSRFFKPWGVSLNGSIYWFGEDSSDRGLMLYVEGVLHVATGEKEELEVFLREKISESEKRHLTEKVSDILDEKEKHHVVPRHKI